jgi:glycogen debranching enzyme
MTSVVDYITQGSRIFFSSWKSRVKPQEYAGTAEQICRKIVKDCWNGQFFQTSTTNFPQFWTRDFGWCTSSLIKLGYEAEVKQTLKYAMNRFQDAGKITTTITPKGKPFDFPIQAVDSLPWLIHSIKLSRFYYGNYKELLNKEIQRLFDEVISIQTGLVKKELHLSSMKDFSMRKSSCYDNCMIAMLAKDLKSMSGLVNPFEAYDYPELIVRNFWNGGYFYDDLEKGEYVAGDANIFPFICGIVGDEDKLRSVLEVIQVAGLDKPLPLRYTIHRKDANFIAQEFLLKNYEGNTIWTHMGPLYIKLVQKMDKWQADEYQKKYAALIEKSLSYPEVLSVKGEEVLPFRTAFYNCDRGMLWAANYLTL